MSQTKDLSLADQIRAIALEGLKYARDSYDIDRYEKLLNLSTQKFAETLNLDFNNLKDLFEKELGCVTPKLGVDGVVLNEKNEVLILERSDQTGWCLPCGWVDVGENPFEAIEREVKEETALCVKAIDYLAISTKGPTKTQNIHHQVNMLIKVELYSMDDIRLSHEHLNYEWTSNVDERKWHSNHREQLEKALNS